MVSGISHCSVNQSEAETRTWIPSTVYLAGVAGEDWPGVYQDLFVLKVDVAEEGEGSVGCFVDPELLRLVDLEQTCLVSTNLPQHQHYCPGEVPGDQTLRLLEAWVTRMEYQEYQEQQSYFD